MENKEYIREIQQAGLAMLHQFDSVCKKHHISYFAISGTLLGAIRHSGYIPWDDDLDIGILRDDYEKLQRIPKSMWGEEIELITAAADDTRHDKLFPRIYLKNSRIQSYKDVKNWKNPYTGESWYTSLMIDIYIFDEIPDDERMYAWYRKRILKLRECYKPVKLAVNLKGSSGISLLKKIIKGIYGMTMRCLYRKPWEMLYNKHEKIIAQIPHGKRVGSFYSSLGQLNVPKEDLYPFQYVKFEDMMIPVPNNYKEFLELNYGSSYMEYPPEKDRYHIKFIYADLGGGRVYNINPIPGSLGEKYIKTNK